MHIPIIGNGDITDGPGAKAAFERYGVDGVMIGRGAIKNPAIFREIKGGAPLKTEELVAFSRLLEERYMSLYSSEVNTLHKLKEVWVYALLNFPEEKKLAKAVKKANKLTELNAAISRLPEIDR